MSTESSPLLSPDNLSSNSSSLPLWDRLTTWASENKVVVYTIAGVVVVVSGAGVAYYLSDARNGSAAVDDRKRLSKKERRKAKQEKEKEATKPKVEDIAEQTKEGEGGSLDCENVMYSDLDSTVTSRKGRVRST